MRARAAATTIAFAALLGATGATAQPTGGGKDSVVSACVRSFEDAQVEQKKGRLVRAREGYQACARQECPAPVRTDCVQALDVVERALPTVSLIVRDRDGRDRDVAITLDGTPVEAGKGRAIPVDPGDHVVAFEAGGRQKTRSFTAHEGEKSRLVVLPFDDDASSDAADEPPPKRGKRSIWPWVLGGAGLLALTAGTVMYVDYKIDESTLRRQFDEANRCDADGIPGCDQNEAARRTDLKRQYEQNEQDADAMAPLMLSLMIGGAAALTSGVVLWVLEGLPASTPSSALLVPTFARGRAGGVLRIEF